MTKTVLVVDDDPAQRRLIQGVLEREGFAVAPVEGGDQAMERLMGGGPADVVLLDLVMPGMTGVETLKEMRARGFTQPVIVLTASGGIDTVVGAMQAGAQDFLVKPAAPERIAVSIKNCLRMGELTAEVSRLKKRASGQVTFDELIGAYKQIILRAHALGLKVYGGTLLPYAGAKYDSPEGEAKRKALNAFTRAPGNFDGYIDFEKAVTDPANPDHWLASVGVGDNLHPNVAGYEAMAKMVDLKVFAPK